MTSKNRLRSREDESFSFGVRELEAAERAAATLEEARREPPSAVDAVRKRVELTLVDTGELRQLCIDDESAGFDPYNSGSFDRRNAWSKVGRR